MPVISSSLVLGFISVASNPSFHVIDSQWNSCLTTGGVRHQLMLLVVKYSWTHALDRCPA